MKKTIMATIGTLFAISLLVGVAFAADLGIITGGEKGTYYQFGLNLQELVQDKGINLSVYNSKGSIENIYAVFKPPRTQMASSSPMSWPLFPRCAAIPCWPKSRQKSKWCSLFTTKKSIWLAAGTSRTLTT